MEQQSTHLEIVAIVKDAVNCLAGVRVFFIRNRVIANGFADVKLGFVVRPVEDAFVACTYNSKELPPTLIDICILTSPIVVN